MTRHYFVGLGPMKCGAMPGNHSVFTNDPSAVTCKWCLTRMVRDWIDLHAPPRRSWWRRMKGMACHV